MPLRCTPFPFNYIPHAKNKYKFGGVFEEDDHRRRQYDMLFAHSEFLIPLAYLTSSPAVPCVIDDDCFGGICYVPFLLMPSPFIKRLIFFMKSTAVGARIMR